MIYLLAYCTGLRKSEMASLTPSSFDLSNGSPTVTVEASYSKRRRKDKIFLPRELVPQLQLGHAKPNSPIFPNLAARKTNKMIRRDLEAASLAYQTDEGKFRDLHSLRHAYITRVWKAGASPIVARKMARHSDLKTTMGYSHVSPDEEREIADKLSGIPKPPDESDAGDTDLEADE